MMTFFSDRSRRAIIFGASAITLLAAVAAYTSVKMSGTKAGIALATLSCIGPLLLYASLIAPLVFPFGLFALLTPLDSILNLPAFGTLTRLLGAASALALLFYMLRTKRFGQPHRNTVWWVLLLLWMTASMFWASDLPSAQVLLLMMLELAGLYLVISMFRVELKAIRAVIVATVAGGVLAAAFGDYLYHTGAAIFSNRLWIHTDTGIINPDHFATSLLLPIGICLVALFWSHSWRVRLLSFGALGLMISTIMLTGTRGAMIGLAAMFVYLMIQDRHRIKIAAMGVPLALGVLAAVGPQHLIQRWQIAGQTGGAGRLSIWHVGILAFKQNWLFGAGIGNFPFAYDRAFIQVFQANYANWHRASHNILLNSAVELGVIGLALLLLGWFGQYRMLAEIPRGDPRYALRLSLQSVLVGLFVSGLFLDLMIEKYVWLAFMLAALTRNALPVAAQSTAPSAASIAVSRAQRLSMEGRLNA